jgi:hypothetical protein
MEETMVASSFSPSTIKELRGVIDNSLVVQTAPTSAPVGGAPLDFCTVWPEAKPVVQALSGIVALIPGFGSAAAAALTALLAVGDTVFKQTCGSKAGSD